MRLRLVLLAAAVAVLMVPVSASAHTTDWYWSAVLAKSRLKTYDVCHESDGGCRDVIDARCTGRGDWIWNDARTLKLYRHFDCISAVPQRGRLVRVPARYRQTQVPPDGSRARRPGVTFHRPTLRPQPQAKRR